MSKEEKEFERVFLSDSNTFGDAVNHPKHYTTGAFEVIDYIDDKLTDDGFYGFCIGNCLKYISRAEHKGKRVEDLKKARWYIDKIINKLEG